MIFIFQVGTPGVAEEKWCSAGARYFLQVWVMAAFWGLLLFSPPAAWSQDQVEFDQWLSAVKAEARERGISKATLDDAFQDVAPIARVIKLDRNQPETRLTLDEYLDLVISNARIATGREKLEEHRDLLQEISSQYEVQPRFLVTLWGVESDFGRLTGNFPVIGALATLAYDGRRSAFFRGELFKALEILDEGHIPVERMEGSWAGAMGQMQFMPSTFHRFAVDFNRNGRVDIWGEKADIFASGANYLSKSGWHGNEIWGREVRLPPEFDRAWIGLKTKKWIRRWQALGVRGLNGGDLPSFDMPASIIQPDGPNGRSFMVYNNYRVLLKWNRSHHFALAVGLLSDQIAR